MAVDKPVIPIKTCEGLAYNMWGAEGLICPIIDARRNQVYTGLYRVKGNVEVILEQQPMDIHELIEYINDYSKKLAESEGGPIEGVTILGDGVAIYQDVIWDEIDVPCKMAPAIMNRQRGASIASYGELLYKEGKYINADDFAPEYLRKSQAERVRESK